MLLYYATGLTFNLVIPTRVPRNSRVSVLRSRALRTTWPRQTARASWDTSRPLARQPPADSSSSVGTWRGAQGVTQGAEASSRWSQQMRGVSSKLQSTAQDVGRELPMKPQAGMVRTSDLHPSSEERMQPESKRMKELEVPECYRMLHHFVLTATPTLSAQRTLNPKSCPPDTGKPILNTLYASRST